MPPIEAFWLALAAARGWSPRRIRQLHDRFGSLGDALSAPVDRWLELDISQAARSALTGLAQPAQILWPAVERWLDLSPLHHLLTLDDPRYPFLLRQIDDPPPLLYLIGDPELLSLPQIALVGSRRGTHQGVLDAQAFAKSLSDLGLIPTSGLALGVDAAAHRGALAGQGLTVAVLGSGVDCWYPAANRTLAKQIVDSGGVLVSEFPLGAPARAGHFPRRNRIISGLSLGVLIIEAAERSGTLVTARLALEQGRELFALPGSIHNPSSRGCHQLIREGAWLVDRVEQIVEPLLPQLQGWSGRIVGGSELSAEFAVAGESPQPQLGLAAERVLAATGFEVTPLDRVILRSGLSVAEVQSLLLELELSGAVIAVAGGYQRS